jgi:hypothetical protein
VGKFSCWPCHRHGRGILACCFCRAANRNVSELFGCLVTIEDKTASEKLRLIEQLEEPDKQALFRMIDCMLTKNKFKDFFQKNVAAL